MNTAYKGDGTLKRGSWLMAFLAMLAMAFFMPLTAAAQEPTDPEPTIEAPADPFASDPFALDEPAPAPAAEVVQEEQENPFSLQYMWDHGDVVARSTLIVMILMFSGTVYIAATKAVDQTILIGHTKKLSGFWEANSLDEGLDHLGQKNSCRPIAEGAIAQANSAQSGLGARISRGDRMSHQVGIELERINQRLQAGMAFLATVGSVAPFVGLFGTVWGIVQALIVIGFTGDPSIEKVAGPVGEALIMTAIGLGVAVPAVVLYNLLGRRNKIIYDNIRHFAYDVEKLMASSTKG